jgi:hypothetical protein
MLPCGNIGDTATGAAFVSVVGVGRGSAAARASIAGALISIVGSVASTREARKKMGAPCYQRENEAFIPFRQTGEGTSPGQRDPEKPK